MVDARARQQAATIVSRYLADEITNDDFMNDFPASTGDRAIKAIESMLGNTQGDLHVHRFSDGPHTTDVIDLYRGCWFFCMSSLEYEWTVHRFAGMVGDPSLLALLTFGLLDQRAFRQERFMQRLNAEGDFDVWPFIRRADYEGVVTAAQRAGHDIPRATTE